VPIANHRYTKWVLLALACTCAGAVTAQDMAAVSPKTAKVIIDNAQVRVLEVNVKPGEKSPMHSHPGNVVVFITPGKIKTTNADGKVIEGERKAGDAIWSDPVTHTNENVGTTAMKVIVVEVKSDK
jgi:quercetin dioxygenase-like cupin family protein